MLIHASDLAISYRIDIWPNLGEKYYSKFKVLTHPKKKKKKERFECFEALSIKDMLKDKEQILHVDPLQRKHNA